MAGASRLATENARGQTVSKFKSIKGMIADGQRFFREEVWTQETADQPLGRRFLFSLCRIGMIVARGFQGDHCSLQASALTYITLVSLVPMVAIMLSFSKGLGMQKHLMDTLGIEKVELAPVPDMPAGESIGETALAQRPPWEYRVVGGAVTGANEAIEVKISQRLPEPMQKALITVFTYVENTNFMALGLVGSLLLVSSVIFSMAKLEDSLNAIWGVNEGRDFLHKISEYLVVLIFVPIVFLVATSVNTLLLSNKFVFYLQENLGAVAWLFERLVRIVGACFVLLGFACFYIFMPNTKVKIFPALMAGLFAGIAWFGVQWAYLGLQVGLTKYNTIYGTFAAVPFFLAWLYANWSIVLFGAEVSFAIQNHRTIHLEKASERASTGACIFLGLAVTYEVCKHFATVGGGWNASEFGREKCVPTRILSYVVNVLCKAGVLARVEGPSDREYLYVPGRDAATITSADVDEAFRQGQGSETKHYLQLLPAELSKKIQAVYGDFSQNLGNLSFAKLIDKTQAASTRS